MTLKELHELLLTERSNNKANTIGVSMEKFSLPSSSMKIDSFKIEMHGWAQHTHEADNLEGNARAPPISPGDMRFNFQTPFRLLVTTLLEQLLQFEKTRYPADAPLRTDPKFLGYKTMRKIERKDLCAGGGSDSDINIFEEEENKVEDVVTAEWEFENALEGTKEGQCFSVKDEYLLGLMPNEGRSERLNLISWFRQMSSEKLVQRRNNAVPDDKSQCKGKSNDKQKFRSDRRLLRVIIFRLMLDKIVKAFTICSNDAKSAGISAKAALVVTPTVGERT